MSFNVGTITQYDDVNSILDPEVIVAAKAITLPANKGRFYQMMQAPARAIANMAFKIYSRSKTALNGVVGNGSGTGWDGSSATSLPMPASAVAGLTVGTVIKVADEIVVVKSVNRSASTIDVFERGAGATSGAVHDDGAAFTVIGYAINDTDLADVESRQEGTLVYENYIQLVSETLDYTYLEKVLDRKGLSEDDIAIFKQEKMRSMSERLAAMAVHGIKRQGTSAIPPMTAGLLEQLTDTAGGARPILRYNASAVAFSETILKAALEEVFKTGNPGTILCSQFNKNIMNGFNQAFISTDREDKVAGYSVAKYEYEGKVLDIEVDADMPSNRVEIVSMDKCRKGWLEGDSLRFEKEPSRSSREDRESLQGSLGFAIEGVGYDHIDIYNLD